MSLEEELGESNKTLKRIADALEALVKLAQPLPKADVKDNVTPALPKAEKPVKAEKPAKAAKPVEVEPEPETTDDDDGFLGEGFDEDPETEVPAVTEADLRAALRELQKGKGQNVAMKFFRQFNYATVDKVPPEKYAEIIAAAKKALG